MQPTRLFAAFTAMMMLATSPVHAAEFTAKDLAAEEGKFAAYSVAHDMRAAFLEFFDDDSSILRPEMVDAKPWLTARPAPGIVLDWKSQLAVLSASGDLGLSTGPWTATSKKDPKLPADHGQFFSIWKRQPNGNWKVLLDHGISHPGAALQDVPLNARELPASAGKPVIDAVDPEQHFILQSAQSGAAKAYAGVITSHSRLLRDDRAPLDGEAAIGEYLKTLIGNWSWNTLRSGSSMAGDFVYVLGRYTQRDAAGATHHGHYIRVWIREQGRWALAGEVMTALPDPAPPKS